MNKSYKLGITQLVLSILMLILGIVYIISFSAAINSGDFFESDSIFIIPLLRLIVLLSVVIIGIIQVVFSVQEQSSKVLLAAGICAIAYIAIYWIPILSGLFPISLIVLNVIGIIQEK